VQGRLSSVYVEHFWKPNVKASVRFGLRANRYDRPDSRRAVPDSSSWSEPTIDWEPRLSLEYRCTEALALKSAWSRHHQYLMQFGDDLPIAFVDDSFSWILADRERVQSSFSEHVVVGAQVSSADFLLDVEFYRKNLQHVFENFDYRQFVRINETDNSLIQYPGRAAGVDVLLQKETGGLTGWLSYSWSRTRILLERNGKTFWMPSTQDTPHNLKLVGNFATGKWNFSATWHYLSGRPYSTPLPEALTEDVVFILLPPQIRNTKRLPDTHRLDASVTRTFSHRYFKGKVGLSVFNVYNRRNVWYRYFTIRNGELTPVDIHVFGAMPTFFLELRW
jgi:hypothetical protein